MKRTLSLLALVLCCVAAALAGVYTPDRVPSYQLQESTRLVSNPDGIISPQAEAEANALLRDIRSRTSAEVTVVLIDDMADDYDIDTYATELFEKWAPGKKDRDNGVLMLVVKNARKYAIRTGYGVEGILPDGLVGRIQRENMRPNFRKGDYDAGVLGAVRQVHDIMTDPKVRDELLSEEGTGVSRHGKDDDLSFGEFMEMYLVFSVVMTLVLLLYVLTKVRSTRGRDRHDRYLALRSAASMAKYGAIIALGLPLLVYFPLKATLNRWRNGRHVCPNCGTDMNKLDEATDNKYLTPAQDAEERLNSVDYDVWLCPNCGETDIYAYNNPSSTLTECPTCHARAAKMLRTRVLRQPTQRTEGQGVRDYVCLNCHKNWSIPFKLAKTAAPPVIIIPGGGGGGGGGGFGGGGFGGGLTGGGGASGGW